MKFRDLAIGQYFDFINDKKPRSIFYDRCIKISARKYRSAETEIVYTVGSINTEVFHVSMTARAD